MITNFAGKVTRFLDFKIIGRQYVGFLTIPTQQATGIRIK
jgi:hypothetical protein